MGDQVVPLSALPLAALHPQAKCGGPLGVVMGLGIVGCLILMCHRVQPSLVGLEGAVKHQVADVAGVQAGKPLYLQEGKGPLCVCVCAFRRAECMKGRLLCTQFSSGPRQQNPTFP